MFLFKRNGFYHLQYLDDRSGKVRRVSTKAKSKTNALKYLFDFQQKLKTKQQVIRLDITLAKFEEEYVQYLTMSKSFTYIKSMKLSFRMLLKYYGDSNPSKINQRSAEKFVSETFSRSKYAATLYYRTLRAAFSKAVEWNYIIINPFAKIKVPKIPNGIPVFISIEEMGLILENTQKEPMCQIFLFALNTGLRLSEILNLHWHYVNLKESLLKISNSKTFTTKGKQERYIPINSTVKNILLDLRTWDNKGLVFRTLMDVNTMQIILVKTSKEPSD